MPESRWYQSEAVPAIRAALVKHRSVVYVLPTGGGKTIIAAEIARRAAAKGSRTMFLVHRRELVKQAIGTLREACPGMSIGVEAAGWPRMPWALLQVGMVQTIVRREGIEPPKLVFIDEAHHMRAAMWEKVIARWPAAALVGLTATPERFDRRGLGKHFKSMVLGPSIERLVSDGFLAPTRTLRLPSLLKLVGLKRDRNGEYSRKDQGTRVTPHAIAATVDAYKRYADGKQAIFFGVNTNHSRSVCEQFRGRGISAWHVDGTDPDSRRDRIMREFRDRSIRVIGNCDIVSEGFDAPSCEVIILGAHTSSVTRYLQNAGRAMRPGPGKTALVLDTTGISHDLGLPDEPREWSLEDGEVKKKRKKNTARACKVCFTLFRAKICPQCGHVPPPPSVPEETSTELEEARRMPRQRGRRSSLWAEVSQAKRSDSPRAALESIAEARGYQPGWALHILRAWGL